MKTIRERNQNRGKFILKVANRHAYFLTAGNTISEDRETRACAQTTMRISEAKGFQTAKSAEAMRRQLKERYGLDTQIVKRERRYDS